MTLTDRQLRNLVGISPIVIGILFALFMGWLDSHLNAGYNKTREAELRNSVETCPCKQTP